MRETQSLTTKMAKQAFIAYPDGFPIIKEGITSLIEAWPGGAPLRLIPWPKMQITGFKLDDLIREHINEAAVLVADVTYPNPNVYYEMGYAIALEKPVLPVINVAIEKSVQRLQRTGLFDTIGWATYNNSAELSDKLKQWPDISWSNTYVRRRNHGQPLFILDTFAKTDFRNHIFHAVENSHLRFRSFDPAEVPRLTASQAVADVSASAGVILPILTDDIVDAEVHNLRAAFMLGLSHGYQVGALAIQYGNGPAPLDYREFITNSTYKRETERHVTEFAAKVLVWNQNASLREKHATLGLLNEIDLGSSTAENETQNLHAYFIRTAEFARALRAEGAVVIGRKGSGKSAVFLQIAELALKEKKTCVVDLRPASHNLTEMREALLTVVSHGLFDHTIAAFWQYVIYVEIILKLREMALPYSRNDFGLQERIRTLEETFKLSESVVAGDFTSRLNDVAATVISSAAKAADQDDLKSYLTNLMFEEPIPRLREAVMSFSDFANDITVLIDDLDKGWPPRQIEAHDISMVKHLIEALGRIKRDMGRKKVDIRHLVFLRSDVYGALIEETSDRGKYNAIKVDWSDPEQLRHLLRQRVISRIAPSHQQEAWDAINPVLRDGTDAVGKMIEGSLRRPRFLIDLCERTLSFAINRGHAFVSESDVTEGLRQMSLYLVSDFGYEMRDIAGTPEDIFYLFIGAPNLLTEEELIQILQGSQLSLSHADTIDLLLWYGFLGVVRDSGEQIYIYNRAYDFRRLVAERHEQPNERLYSVNPAFLLGLEKTDTPVNVH